MSVKDIANLLPAMSSVSLVSRNIKEVKKKKISTKDLLGMGLTNIVGASLIKTQADIVAGL